MNPLYRETDYQRERQIAEESHRSAFRRDYGRLIHCPAFRRLQGKTQLFPGAESDFFRNRLTHSIEVAQIAKTIAMRLNGREPQLRDASPGQQIDYDLIETAALAHDLGHPPFGHNGERALDKCMREYGGFEGNAQTLRILSKIEKKIEFDEPAVSIVSSGKDVRRGLNLTYRTLAAVLKYDLCINLKRSSGDKLQKGYFQSERELVRKIKNAVAPEFARSGFKTVECWIMEIADDIAYSTYDLEDALKASFVTPLRLFSQLFNDADLLNRIAKKANEHLSNKIEAQDVILIAKRLFDEAMEQLPKTDTDKDGEQFLRVYRRSHALGENGYLRTAFTSHLVSRFANGVRFHYDSAWPALSRVDLIADIHQEVEVLKHLTYEVIVMSPRVQLVEYRGSEVVEEIFSALSNVDQRGNLLLPSDRRELYELFEGTDDKLRTVCDFIAGMTDRYAMDFYSRIKETGQSIFRPF